MIQYLTACVSLLMCAALQCALAAKDHWNPKNANHYHQFKFPKRSQETLDKRIDYQGWSFAGVSEFPWLVEIRGNDTEDFEHQEDWSNGNLVSSKFVLTVCIAVVNFRLYEAGRPEIDKDPLNHIGIDQTYLSPKNPKYYKVLFSDDYTYKSVEYGYYTGTRQIRRFSPHPKCNHFELDYQWGVVEIKKPIWPVPPYTSYMPTDFRRSGYAEIKERYVTNKVNLEHSAPCTVGLWSRYVNTELVERDKNKRVVRYNNQRMLNYKIKYAVVPTDPKDCWYKAIESFPNRVRVGDQIEDWECMAINSNETVGTVCDHDRGAPIVCDGIVRAVVLAGATEEFCNMSLPMPFLVMDIKYSLQMFSETSNEVWQTLKLKEYLRV